MLQIGLIIGVALASYMKRTISARLIILSLFSLFVPLLIYHYYMYINTGELLPSSIASRTVRTSEYTLLIANYIQFKANPQLYLIPVLMFFYFWRVYKSFGSHGKNLVINLFLLAVGIALFLATIILLFSKSISTRYIDFLFIFVIVDLSIFYIQFLNKKVVSQTKIMTLSIFLVLCSFAYKVILPEYPNNSTLEARLAPDLARQINTIPDARKLAMYEIQTQFYINRPVVSLDARVGSEMLSFVLGKSDLLTAMYENDVGYIGVDHNVSPKIAKDDLYQFMLSLEKTEDAKDNFIHSKSGKT